MPKLRVFSGRQLRAILETNGYVFIRQRGSHIVMRRIDGKGRPIPVQGHREIATGTLRGIISQSGLPRSLFETK